jgi:hypothetical protein
VPPSEGRESPRALAERAAPRSGRKSLRHNCFVTSPRPVDLNGGRPASAKATAIARVDAPMNKTVSSVAIAGFPVDWPEGYLMRVR